MEQYHTGWQRFIASWIDSFILSMLTGVIGWLFTLPLGIVVKIALAFAYSALHVVYPIYMHGRFGQTLGKFFVKVKVVNVNGRGLSYAQAALRDIVPCLLLPFSMWPSLYVAITGEQPNLAIYQSLCPLALMWVLLEMVTMLFNPQRRAIHDFIAQTVVIRVP